MNLSQKHQVTFDEYFPDGYVPKKVIMPDGTFVADEADYFHIMYIDIIDPGKNPRRVPCLQKYSVAAWAATKELIEGRRPGVEGTIHATGHDEYAIIHDPVEAKAEAEAKAKEAAEKAKADEAKKKAAEPVIDKTAKAETKADVKPGAKRKGRPPQK